MTHGTSSENPRAKPGINPQTSLRHFTEPLFSAEPEGGKQPDVLMLDEALRIAGNL